MEQRLIEPTPGQIRAAQEVLDAAEVMSALYYSAEQLRTDVPKALAVDIARAVVNAAASKTPTLSPSP